DAARIDGCNLFQTIVLICLPLIKSGIAVVVIFSIIWTWNDLLFGLIMTQSEAKTLPVVISGHSGQTDTKWELMASLAFIQLIPIIIFTFFSQRHIVTGLTMGGVEK
ncbi:ABC transporter permease subunit, partial [Paenibacillus alkaliterrae]